MWIWYKPKIPAEIKIALKIDVFSKSKLKIIPLKRIANKISILKGQLRLEKVSM